jgi:Na+/melibiose symporter-like transporter
LSQVSLVPILLWLAALVAAALAIWQGPRPIDRSFVIDRLLRYLFLFPLGLLGLWAFIGHVFFGKQSAASIGWEPSPFQYEVGVANLGLALASLYAAFRGFEARVAVAIAAACFLIGAGIGHIRDIVLAGNLAPGNAGPIMVTDFLTPFAILALLFLANQKQRPKSQATLALEAELENARKAMRQYRNALSQLGKD